MRKYISMTLILLTISLCGCSNKTIDSQVPDENPYLLVNGLAPTEMISKIDKFIIAVYMPYSQDTIDNAIKKFEEIATDAEINELKDTVGAYNPQRKAKVSDVKTLLCTPDNSSNNRYKILSTFTITLGDKSQNLLIEFGLNNECKVESHSIWINNDTDH